MAAQAAHVCRTVARLNMQLTSASFLSRQSETDFDDDTCAAIKMAMEGYCH